MKPKLLFKEEIDRLKRENGEDDDDEEAPTDIELPIATPSRRTRHVDPAASFPQDSAAPVTKTVKRRKLCRVYAMIRANSVQQKCPSRAGAVSSRPAHLPPAARSVAAHPSRKSSPLRSARGVSTPLPPLKRRLLTASNEAQMLDAG
jgi:hypothetical protein